MVEKLAVDRRQVWHGACPDRWQSAIGDSSLAQINKELAKLSCLLPNCSDVGPKRAWQNREYAVLARDWDEGARDSLEAIR